MSKDELEKEIETFEKVREELTDKIHKVSTRLLYLYDLQKNLPKEVEEYDFL